MRARKLIYPLLLILATPLNVHSQSEAFRDDYVATNWCNEIPL